MISKPSEETRIGVFVCDCGMNIAGTIDNDQVVEFAKTLPGVVSAVRSRYSCSDPGQNDIRRIITENRVNRVVIAACTPKLHEPTFRSCVEEAGLNKYLMEMVNLREHCSWVHQQDPVGATDKALDLLKSAVARSMHLEPLEEMKFPVTRAALVIGGGVAGIQAALDLADAGNKVYIVEKEPSLGGVMPQLAKTYPTMDCPI
jgi:heterodisulfide reductase subunit A